MKNISILVLLACAIFLQSCDRTEGTVFNVDSGSTLAKLSSSIVSLPVEPGDTSTEIDVFVNTRSSSDRSIEVTIDPSSTADPSSYTISGVIPANEFIGKINVKGFFDNLPSSGVTELIIDVATIDGQEVNVENGRATISMFRFCPSNLEGDYAAVSQGTSTDGCCPGTYNVTSTVTLTATGGGNYTVSDWSGGLYLEWYAIYGITPTNSPGAILDICNEITFLTSTEPFGESLSATWTRDESTGVISVSWSNGWGDQGTSVLTPL